MTKRHKFIFNAVFLSVLLLGVNFLENQYRILGVSALAITTAALFYWSLSEGLGRNATLLTLFLPPFFTLGVGIFWFLLPSSVLARVPIVLLYAVGLYALALTANIFTVSAVRTIALLRAAKGVGFVLSLFTSFLLYDSILSLRADLPIVIFLVSVVSFPMFLQGLWVVSLDRELKKRLIVYGLIFSYFVSALALFIYFWPVSVIVGSVMLTLAVYVLLGLGQTKEEGRLFRQTVREYLIVAFLVFTIIVLTTSWRG